MHEMSYPVWRKLNSVSLADVGLVLYLMIYSNWSHRLEPASGSYQYMFFQSRTLAMVVGEESLVRSAKPSRALADCVHLLPLPLDNMEEKGESGNKVPLQVFALGVSGSRDNVRNNRGTRQNRFRANNVFVWFLFTFKWFF